MVRPAPNHGRPARRYTGAVTESDLHEDPAMTAAARTTARISARTSTRTTARISSRPVHPFRLLADGFLWLVTLQTRARMRAALAELDDRQLADAGLSRAELMAGLARPFWRR